MLFGGLNMKIKGYFPRIKDANRAIKNLKDEGYNKAFLDINDHQMDKMSIQTNNPGTENGGSYSALTLGSGEEVIDDVSKTPLMAASPMASGMGEFDEISGFRCSIEININDDDYEAVDEIISNNGGTLKDPNLNLPSRVKTIDDSSVRIPRI